MSARLSRLPKHPHRHPLNLTGRRRGLITQKITHHELFGDDPFPIVARTIELNDPAPVRAYDCVTFTLVQSGSYLKTLPDRDIRLRRGHLVISDHTVHAAHIPLEPTTAVINLYIGRKLLARELRWLTRCPRFRAVVSLEGTQRTELPLVIELTPQLHAALTVAMTAISRHDPTAAPIRGLRRLARFLDIIDRIEQGLSDADVPATVRLGVLPAPAPSVPMFRWRPALVHAVNLLREDPGARWTLDGLAAQVHISRRQLVRLFRSQVGISTMQYLTEIRLQRLAILLESSAMSFTSATREVGWTNSHHARELFLRRFGQGPDEYRHRG